MLLREKSRIEGFARYLWSESNVEQVVCYICDKYSSTMATKCDRPVELLRQSYISLSD